MSSLHSIENSDIFLEIDALGAEWKTLLAFDKQSSCLWAGKKEIWPRHAPILFPIVGKLQQGSYSYKDCQYTLSPHGFARDSVFQLVEKSDNEIRLRLGASHFTKGHYPFDFNLEISYRIDKNVLLSTYKIANLEESVPLPFSVGAHPGFSYDWLPKGKNWKDVRFEFEANEEAFLLLNKEGLLDISLRSKEQLSNRHIHLHPAIFDRDALILSPIKSKKVDMLLEGSSRKIRMHFDEAFAFGLWSKRVEEFVCMEPWWGMPDFAGHSGQLIDKKGLIWLEPRKSHAVSWKIEFINVDKG